MTTPTKSKGYLPDEELGSDVSSAGDPEEVNSPYEILMSKKETSRIRMFRLMVVAMLIMTAAVTIMAKVLLGHEETRNFETAVRVNFVCSCVLHAWL